LTVDEPQHCVTLDWGTESVHLASGRYSPVFVDGQQVEQAVCGFYRSEIPKEGDEDSVDPEFICKRCRASEEGNRDGR